MISGKDLPMIQQTTPTEQASAKRLSPQEALVSLLIASARADGSVSAHEANSIEHVVAGMKLFRGHSHEGLQKVFATAAERITEQGTQQRRADSSSDRPEGTGRHDVRHCR